jgi:hypothetical protein
LIRDGPSLSLSRLGNGLADKRIISHFLTADYQKFYLIRAGPSLSLSRLGNGLADKRLIPPSLSEE